MNEEYTEEQKRQDAYKDICDIIILHSLSFEELLKLDGPLFPIDFEVWAETESVLCDMNYKHYEGLLDEDIASEIKVYLESLLKLSSKYWTHSEFENNPFWEKSRVKAQEFVSKLNLGNRTYWN